MSLLKQAASLKNKAAMKQHDEAKLARKDAAKTKSQNKAINAALKSAQLSFVNVITTKTQIEALVDKHKGDKKPNLFITAVRDQIKVRIHVHGMKATDLARVGTDTGPVAKERLLKALYDMIKHVLPARKIVMAYPSRQALPAPTEEAKRLHKDYTNEVNNSYRELLSLVNNGCFRATPRRRKQFFAATQDDTYRNTEFTRGKVEFKVLKIAYSCSQNEVLVWFFNIDLAYDTMVSEDQMLSVIETEPHDNLLPPMGSCTLEKLKEWIDETTDNSPAECEEDDEEEAEEEEE